MDYWQHQRPMNPDSKELRASFSYFNTNVSVDALRAAGSDAAKKILDGRHPVGGNAFIRIGSFMTSVLVEKNGVPSFEKYFKGGAIPFFADYVRLYKSDKGISTQLRFTPAFEALIERWNTDWTRTWNDYTRNVVLSANADLVSTGARLTKEFAGAEVYPDFSRDFQRIQLGEFSLTSSKIGVDLYPTSDELLFNLGYFLIVFEQSKEGRDAARRIAGNYERPLVYFKRAFAANPHGVMAPQTFLDLGRRWLRRSEMHAAAVEFVTDGIVLHPKEAALYELLGDLLIRKGQSEQAATNFRTAYQLDPKLAKGATLEEYVAARMKIN
jgi:tetratricopeptide (TPR) repeat protein